MAHNLIHGYCKKVFSQKTKKKRPAMKHTLATTM